MFNLTRLWKNDRSPVGLRLFELKNLQRPLRAHNEAIVRGLCANAYLGEDTALCRVLGRYKMFVDTRDRGLSSHLLLEGYWEMWLTEALAETVRSGMTVIDVGANLGYFSLLMAELVGPQGRVHAFEPNAALAEKLRQSADVNGYWETIVIHAQALSDAERDNVLLVPDGEPKNAYLVGRTLDAEASPAAQVVRTRRLDSYPELADADVIKIDADTSEQAIWRGMSGILERGRPMTIFLEFAAARYEDPAGFLAEIAVHGFDLKYVSIDDGIVAADMATILALPSREDVMLMLTRDGSGS